MKKMYNTAWKSARERAAQKWAERYRERAPEGFRNVRVHDLKHTFGRRLRAAGVSFEDRQDLLGHKGGGITTHYSQAELSNLIAAAEKVCETESRKSPATSPHADAGASLCHDDGRTRWLELSIQTGHRLATGSICRND
jgi:hypothetical protein